MGIFDFEKEGRKGKKYKQHKTNFEDDSTIKRKLVNTITPGEGEGEIDQSHQMPYIYLK